MQSDPNRKRLIVAAILCSAYFILTVCYHHIDKYLSGPIFILLTLLIPLLFITLVVLVIGGAIRNIGSSERRQIRSWLPTLLSAATLLNSIFNPLNLSSERLESGVVLRGCYEGTQNQAYVLFRQDSTFELHATGVFFSDDWYLGTWSRRGDTMLLDYDGASSSLGNAIVIDGGYFRMVDKQAGSSDQRPQFYLGYCKHEN
jgi:hypothetical protein